MDRFGAGEGRREVVAGAEAALDNCQTPPRFTGRSILVRRREQPVTVIMFRHFLGISDPVASVQGSLRNEPLLDPRRRAAGSWGGCCLSRLWYLIRGRRYRHSETHTNPSPTIPTDADHAAASKHRVHSRVIVVSVRGDARALTQRTLSVSGVASGTTVSRRDAPRASITHTHPAYPRQIQNLRCRCCCRRLMFGLPCVGRHRAPSAVRRFPRHCCRLEGRPLHHRLEGRHLGRREPGWRGAYRRRCCSGARCRHWCCRVATLVPLVPPLWIILRRQLLGAYPPSVLGQPHPLQVASILGPVDTHELW